ncbi:hypothetical protein AWZ03_001491 [Drosophila navojoa]|uniref:Uncharacterized protein n=1 Tax=Drosophila navojoa TaxID=7232 RepID=A0A484BVU0_DRONA|nr:hypothetical protein AWZ03_001491 [Drosophila navojoa]
MTKIIVGGRPSGLQYSVEFDMYVSLPDTVDGWRPNILLDHDNPKKATGAKPMHRWDWKWHDYRRNGSRFNYAHLPFSLPEDVAEDKYQHRRNVRDCASFYAISCPYRVLDFLTMNVNASRKTE